MDYDQLKIRDFKHWGLFLHANQYPYVGRCYAWAHREHASTVTSMRIAEQEELFGLVLPEWNRTIRELYTHDWPNVACFGNTSPHLHWHFIPRYHSPRLVHGITFIDPNPRGNYAPYERKKLDLEVLLKIKEDIQAKL
ncbi:hypothetical protein GF342_02900 [Candidatus Woesearchaeota archaeon]|nr:hypothetical protein [Candidatus Woesearchaeota archaeon]